MTGADDTATDDAAWRPDWAGDAPTPPAPSTFDPPASDAARREDAPSSAPSSPWAPAGAASSSPLLSATPTAERPRIGARDVADDEPSRWRFPSMAPVEEDAVDQDAADQAAAEARAEPDVDTPSGDPRDAAVDDQVVDIAFARRPRPRWLPLAAAAAVLVIGLVVLRGLLGSEPSTVDGPRLPDAIDERWTTSIGERFVLESVVTSEAVIVVTGRVQPGGVELTAFDTADGSERWSRPLDSVATDLALVADDLVVVSATREFAEGRYSFAVDPATGDERWSRPSDGVVLSTPEMGVVGIADSGRFPSTEPSLELLDLTTGETIPPIGGRLAGLGADGDVLAIDDDGTVRTIDVSSYDPDEPGGELPTEIVATTSPERRNVVELDGRYFATADGTLVEVGFAADAGRVLLDRRPDDQRSDPLPVITPSSFFAPVDGSHAAMLGVDGSMGIELLGDELRIIWSADGAFELPRRVDGDVVAIEVFRTDAGEEPLSETTQVELLDAATGDVLVSFEGLPASRLGAPVDGVWEWRDVTGTLGADPRSFAGTVVAVGLDGTRRWEFGDVTTGPFLGERTVVVGRRDGADTELVFLDEGPRSRPSS